VLLHQQNLKKITNSVLYKQISKNCTQNIFFGLYKTNNYTMTRDIYVKINNKPKQKLCNNLNKTKVSKYNKTGEKTLKLKLKPRIPKTSS